MKPTQPTSASLFVFRSKATLLILRRAIIDRGSGVRRYPSTSCSGYDVGLSESTSPLWSESDNASSDERRLELGKVQNLRIAASRLDGVAIPAGCEFSFWKQVGCADRLHGFVRGRTLREGCLMPGIGGGLCQLSNALYQAAVDAGFAITERHRHSVVVPGSAAEQDRDATVAFNYIDLRFRPDCAVRMRVQLTSDDLVVKFEGKLAHTATQRPQMALAPHGPRPLMVVNDHSCATCGATSCAVHKSLAKRIVRPHWHAAFLLDEKWPEIEAYVRQARQDQDILGVPINGARRKIAEHRWDTAGFGVVGDAWLQSAARSLDARRLGQYGARRIASQMQRTENIARRLSSLLTIYTTRVCVSQSLLPFLWSSGALGGRETYVLMTRLPLGELHARLDEAAARYPERTTLSEYRAAQWIVEAEAEALAGARRIVTPHAEIAKLFAERSVLLPWHIPPSVACTRGASVGFPGPTAARKGAYELREAARNLDLEIVLYGSELEGSDFWEGVRVRRGTAIAADCLAAMVQPALVEDKPRLLLRALANGIPVVATPACGLGDRTGVTTIEFGDIEALEKALAPSQAVSGGL